MLYYHLYYMLIISYLIVLVCFYVTIWKQSTRSISWRPTFGPVASQPTIYTNLLIQMRSSFLLLIEDQPRKTGTRTSFPYCIVWLHHGCHGEGKWVASLNAMITCNRVVSLDILVLCSCRYLIGVLASCLFIFYDCFRYTERTCLPVLKWLIADKLLLLLLFLMLLLMLLLPLLLLLILIIFVLHALLLL